MPPQGFLGDFAEEKENAGEDFKTHEEASQPEPGTVTDPTDPFPFPPSEIPEGDRRALGLGPSDGQVYRYSVAYRVEYAIGGAPGERGEEYGIGTIEIRAHTWTHSPDRPTGIKPAMVAATHRAGRIFNSTVQTSAYGGFLDGFHGAGGDLMGRTDYEGPTPVSAPASKAGATEWHLVIYDENGDMRGHAGGTANIWKESQVEVPGEPAQHVAPHKWGLSYNPSRESYEVHPPARTNSRKRYKPGGAAHDKRVYVNGKYVGQLDEKPRAWIKKEYQTKDGKTWGEQWSRKGLVEDTEATFQAIAKGGTLYMTGETETAIHLKTAGAVGDDWRGADPDEVSASLEVRAGRDATVHRTLAYREGQDPTPITVKIDEQTGDLMGYSNPEYTHRMLNGWWV